METRNNGFVVCFGGRFNRTVKTDWLGVGRAFAKRSVKDDCWVSDMSRQGVFCTGMMKSRAETSLGGKIKGSDLDVTRLRCVWGTQAIQYVDLKSGVRDLKVTGTR